MQADSLKSRSNYQSSSGGSNAQSKISVNSQRLSQMIDSLQNEEDERRLYATYTYSRSSATSTGAAAATATATAAANANANANITSTLGNNLPHLPPQQNYYDLPGSRIGIRDNSNNNSGSQTSKSSSPALTAASLHIGVPPTIWKTATQSSQRFTDNLSSVISNYSGIVDEGIEVSYVVKKPRDSYTDFSHTNTNDNNDPHYVDQPLHAEEVTNSNAHDTNSTNTTARAGSPTTGSSFISTNTPQPHEDIQISKISNAVKVGHHPPTRMSSLNRASNLQFESRVPSINNSIISNGNSNNNNNSNSNNNNGSSYYGSSNNNDNTNNNITSLQTPHSIEDDKQVSSPSQPSNGITNVKFTDSNAPHPSSELVLMNDDSKTNHLRNSSIRSGHLASESGASSSVSISQYNMYPQSSMPDFASGSQVPLLLPDDHNDGTVLDQRRKSSNNYEDNSARLIRQQSKYGTEENIMESTDGFSVVSSVVQPLQTMTDSSKNDISPKRTELKDVSPAIPRRSSARLRNKAKVNRISAPATAPVVPTLPLGIIPDTQPVSHGTTITSTTTTTTPSSGPASMEGMSFPQSKVGQDGLHIHQPVRIRDVDSAAYSSGRRRKVKSTPSGSYYDELQLEADSVAGNVSSDTGTANTQHVEEGKKKENIDTHQDSGYLVRPLPEVPLDGVYYENPTPLGSATAYHVEDVSEKTGRTRRIANEREEGTTSSSGNTGSSTANANTKRTSPSSTSTRNKNNSRKTKKHVHSIDIDTLNQLLNVTKGTLIGSEFTNLGMQFEERKLLEKLVDSLSRLTADMILDPDRYEEGLRRLEKATKALDGF